MSYKGISDFRSDTVTRPTEEMRLAMYKAEVGDDVHGDDPTVNRLEDIAAEKLGKEAALFVPSGTMGNTIAMKIGAGEGKGVLLEEKSHIFNFEAGNVARVAQSLPRTLPSNKGKIPLYLIEQNIITKLREHMPETRAIALENTHNLCGGAILEPGYLAEVAAIAQKYNLHFHLDGARVFNASVALGLDVKEIVKYVDSVMFCLSKGLSAPIGSILAGSKEFIKEAREIRKFLGGGMRQVGIIAAAGIVALEKMVDRLIEDHDRARKLAQEIIDLKDINLNLEDVVTNFLLIELHNMHADEFITKLANNDVWALPFNDRLIRFVTHKDIDDNDIHRAAKVIRSLFS